MLVLNADRGEIVVFIFAYIYNPHHLFDPSPHPLPLWEPLEQPLVVLYS